MTVRPVSPAARTRAAVRSLSLSRLAVDLARVVDVVLEGLVGADALLALLALDRRGSRPQDSSCRWWPGGVAEARARGCPAGCGRCRRRCAAPAGAGPPRCVPRRPTARRPAAAGRSGTTSSRGTTTIPSGLARPGGELGDELRRGDPDRAGDALLVVDGVADLLADRRRGCPAGAPRRRRRGRPRRATAARRPGSPRGRSP